MRIQETNEILKESRHARHAATQIQDEGGMMTKAWRMLSSLPHKLTSMFHK
jgi:hypothetical protein